MQYLSSVWYKLGLINVPLTSALNTIPLCPTCHCEFGKTIDAGVVFTPTDIECFIEFELGDRERRHRAAEQGGSAARRVKYTRPIRRG